MRTLCGADRNRGLQFQFFRMGFNGYHSSLGFVHSTVNEMQVARSENGKLRLVGKTGMVRKLHTGSMVFDLSHAYLCFVR